MFALPFESLFGERSLQTAFERIHSKAVGADGTDIAEFGSHLSQNLKRLRGELISGTYAPEPMLKAKLQRGW